MIYVGVDNGCTGSIGIIDTKTNSSIYLNTPVFESLSYLKSRVSFLNRVNVNVLESIFVPLGKDVKVMLERPMVNPARFNQSLSAMRALEATLIVLERLNLRYEYIDSKEWQKALLPQHDAKADLKKLSKEIGMRFFPQIEWKNFKDADGLLIAEYCRIKDNERK